MLGLMRWGLGGCLVIVEERFPRCEERRCSSCRRRVSAGRRAYVLVNNRAEGNALVHRGENSGGSICPEADNLSLVKDPIHTGP